MTIGEKIKELRKKNDLTQERLADYLGVTYQAVSKWETGLSSPDLALIAPLTRLMHVSADELLGIAEPKSDERKAYFDAEYYQHLAKEDREADYKMALQAVAEYPGEFEYIDWLASAEVSIALDCGSSERFTEMMESSNKHYLMVLNDCGEEKLRKSAISGLAMNFYFLKQYDVAKKYAEMYPENNGYSRDELIEAVLPLESEERLIQRQKIIYKELAGLTSSLMRLYIRKAKRDKRAKKALDTEETIIRTVIDDGNFGHFFLSLYIISENRAEILAEEGDFDGAVAELKKAKEYALEYDKMREKGSAEYTSDLLDCYVRDYSKDRRESTSLAEFLFYLKGKCFAPLRDREDFKALMEI